MKAANELVVETGGPDVIQVSGRPTLLSQLHSSGVVSRTPSGDRDRTSRMCSPSGRFTSSSGDGHGIQGPRSTEHSNVEPSMVDEKTNRAGPLTISASGPTSMVVSGASTTVNCQLAGVGSAFTVWSVGSMMTARTRK